MSMKVFHRSPSMKRTFLIPLIIPLLCTPLFSCTEKEEKVPAPLKTERVKQKKGEIPGKINHPPIISTIDLFPEDPTTETDISVKAEGKDEDGDFVDLKYQWFKNGEKLIGEIGKTLSSKNFERGDFIQVRVTPWDRFGEGVSRISRMKEIMNAPPRLISALHAGQNLDGVRLRLEDPDRDEIFYTMENAPPDMSLSPDGTIHFKGSFDHEGGEWNTKITCSDRHGGIVEITIPIRMRAGKPPEMKYH